MSRAMLLIPIFLAGCGIQTVEPVHNATNQFFEPALTGNWTLLKGKETSDSGEPTVSIEKATDGASYILELRDATDPVVSRLQLYLFRIGDDEFAETEESAEQQFGRLGLKTSKIIVGGDKYEKLYRVFRITRQKDEIAFWTFEADKTYSHLKAEQVLNEDGKYIITHDESGRPTTVLTDAVIESQKDLQEFYAKNVKAMTLKVGLLRRQ